MKGNIMFGCEVNGAIVSVTLVVCGLACFVAGMVAWLTGNDSAIPCTAMVSGVIMIAAGGRLASM